MNKAHINNNNIDDNVDKEIYDCLNIATPKSFFVFAGAGSGKTRSLVNVLGKFKQEYGEEYRRTKRKVAIITYTNAAANEIKQRLENDSIFFVSTIHSFAWNLIKTLTTDIKSWLSTNLTKELIELNEAQLKSRDLNNKSSIDRARRIESKNNRLELLPQIVKFIYNPNGDNISKDSLNHTEVIAIIADFIRDKALMQDIVISIFPILLVDESQDTKKELIEALFKLQENKKAKFLLGLFGDTMQRIYADGKEGLGNQLPSDWLKPIKKMNHRSNKRIITLVNDIRKAVDGQIQIPRVEKEEGIVRLFICDRTSNKNEIEEKAIKKMAELSKDTKWNLGKGEVMTLILEHHMAAKRMNFIELFEPLYKADKLKTGLIDGTLSSLKLFLKIILPLVEAHRKKDKFSVARIVKQYCPLLDKKVLLQAKSQIDNIKNINESVNQLLALWDLDRDPKLIDILDIIKTTSLFPIPSPFDIIISRTEEDKKNIEASLSVEDENVNEVIDAWDIALQSHFSQIEHYSVYLSESSAFGTQQGVKGLEYDRVMVIIDDDEARGFMFSYDKLFGSKELTTIDKKNLKEGTETGIDRTRRLFYVACSRAKESLAIVAHTNSPEIVKNNVVKYGWFKETEVEML